MDGLLTPRESVDRFLAQVRNAHDKRKIVDAINFLLCNYKHATEPYNMSYEAAELKIALERFGVADV